jgi:hypothetical protein
MQAGFALVPALAVVVIGGFAIAARGGGDSATVTPQDSTPPTTAPAPPRDEATATGIAGIAFGTPQPTARQQLVQLFGKPTQALHALGLPAACGIDSGIAWHETTAYFFGQKFVGYLYQPSARLHSQTLHSQTLKAPDGIRIGQSLAEAKAAGGPAFTWSYSQGGSWTLHTPAGQLEGLLTAVPPQGNIEDLAAGSLGCPGMVP